MRAIVTTLAAHVNRAETERALLKPPAAWEAYEYCNNLRPVRSLVPRADTIEGLPDVTEPRSVVHGNTVSAATKRASRA